MYSPVMSLMTTAALNEFLPLTNLVMVFATEECFVQSSHCLECGSLLSAIEWLQVMLVTQLASVAIGFVELHPELILGRSSEVLLVHPDSWASGFVRMTAYQSGTFVVLQAVEEVLAGLEGHLEGHRHVSQVGEVTSSAYLLHPT